jgi:hypothetical protein
MLLRSKLYLPLLLLVFFCAPIYSQDAQPPDPPVGFEKIEQMIPMRDGVKLHTIIYKPTSQREPLPILFQRTPYGIDNTYRAFPSGILKEVIEDGYIFALSGYSRPIQIRRSVCDAAPASYISGSKGDR